jgi:hypothetical protein
MRSMAMAFPVRSEIAGTAVQTTSRELGEGGVFVYSADLPALRATANLTLYIPGGPLEVATTVRSIEGKPPGFWADFLTKTSETRERVLRALASNFEQVETPAGGVAKFDPTKPAAGRNRRAVPRSQEKLPLTVEGRACATADLSAAGLYAVTQEQFDEGTLVRMTLQLPDQQPPAGFIAVVVRRSEHPEHGIAVQFAAADDSFRARLDAYLAVKGVLG